MQAPLPRPQLGPLDRVSIRRVCDAEGEGCFNAALIDPVDASSGRVARGPSGEVYADAWGEHVFLSPIFKHALNSTCFHRDGSRKTVVDVGANIGLYSLYFASRGCTVHAVEPVPVNGDHIDLSVRLNGFNDHFFLHRYAISTSASGFLRMRFAPQETGLSHAVGTENGYYMGDRLGLLRTARTSTPYFGRNWTEIVVPTTQLDRLLRKVGRIEWLKIGTNPAVCLRVCASAASVASCCANICLFVCLILMALTSRLAPTALTSPTFSLTYTSYPTLSHNCRCRGVGATLALLGATATDCRARAESGDGVQPTHRDIEQRRPLHP